MERPPLAGGSSRAQFRSAAPLAAAAASPAAAALLRPASARVKSFTLGGPAPSPSPSPALSRPPSSASGGALTDSQRVASFSAELSRLAASAASPSLDASAAQAASYVLLRRADHDAVRRALFASEDSASAASAAAPSPSLPWSSLMRLFRSSALPVPVLAHCYAMVLLSAGRWVSEDLGREFVASRRGGGDGSIAASSAVSSSPMQCERSFRCSWSWRAEFALVAQGRCVRDMASILSPLIASMQSSSVKPVAHRVFECLQPLWVGGIEIVLSLLLLQDERKEVLSALRGASSPAQSASFLQALQAYVSALVQQLPRAPSSTLVFWRLIELAFEVFWSLALSTEDSSSDEAGPLWTILAAAWRELCAAPGCNCCLGAAAGDSSASAGFDPFASSSQSRLSIAALLLRFVRISLDDPARPLQPSALLERLPIVLVLCFHAMLFHSTDAPGASSSLTARSPLVVDAEYILTRIYFAPKHVAKLLPLLSSPAASGSAPFVPTVAMYLPPDCEKFLAAQSCAHVVYKKQGLNSWIAFPQQVAGSLASTSVSASASLSPSSSQPQCSTSLIPTPHSNHLFGMVLGLLRKFLLFSSPPLSAADSTPHASASSGSSSAPVRVVKDLQGSKLPRLICSTLSSLLSDLLCSGLRADDPQPLAIQAAILEHALSTATGQSVRFREVFDLALALPASAAAQGLSGRDILFGLGVRVVLVLVDAIAAEIESCSAAASELGSAVVSVRSTPAALLSERIACVVQDLLSVLGECASLAPAARDPPLQVGDVFDLSYRTSATRPPRPFPAGELVPLLRQVLAFLQSAAQRVNPMQPASSFALAPSAPPTAAVPYQIASPLRRPLSSQGPRSGRSGFSGSRSSAARAPSYSPPSTAFGVIPALPSPRAGSADALSPLSGRSRSYKVAPVGLAALDDRLAGSPRPVPPPTKAPHVASASAESSPLLAPLHRPQPPPSPQPQERATARPRAPKAKE